MLMTTRMVRLTNFITTAKRSRAKRSISNIDSSWYKRLKLTYKLHRLKKRKIPQRKNRRRMKRSNNENNDFKPDITEIIPQCFVLPINESYCTIT